jgi:hypothetical protein
VSSVEGEGSVFTVSLPLIWETSDIFKIGAGKYRF